MLELEHGISFDLGQWVRLASAPADKIGYVVGVLLIPPYSTLVRWGGAEATFEALENLVAIEPTLF
jgi:glucose-6-phosphate dehydrogenase assembly protein OpcA